MYRHFSLSYDTILVVRVCPQAAPYFGSVFGLFDFLAKAALQGFPQAVFPEERVKVRERQNRA